MRRERLLLDDWAKSVNFVLELYLAEQSNYYNDNFDINKKVREGSKIILRNRVSALIEANENQISFMNTVVPWLKAKFGSALHTLGRWTKAAGKKLVGWGKNLKTASQQQVLKPQQTGTTQTATPTTQPNQTNQATAQAQNAGGYDANARLSLIAQNLSPDKIDRLDVNQLTSYYNELEIMKKQPGVNQAAITAAQQKIDSQLNKLYGKASTQTATTGSAYTANRQTFTTQVSPDQVNRLRTELSPTNLQKLSDRDLQSYYQYLQRPEVIQSLNNGEARQLAQRIQTELNNRRFERRF